MTIILEKEAKIGWINHISKNTFLAKTKHKVQMYIVSE